MVAVTENISGITKHLACTRDRDRGQRGRKVALSKHRAGKGKLGWSSGQASTEKDLLVFYLFCFVF